MISELHCHVHLADTDLRSTLQHALAEQPDTGRVIYRFFDTCDSEARQLLVHDFPLDHDGVTREEPRQVHLGILGFGRMGRALAVRAAQLGHFASGKRLQISVIDRCAKDRRAELLFRYPRITEVCDLEFHQLEALSPEARSLVEGWCVDDGKITSLAVCFDNEQRALEIAVQLLPYLRTTNVRLALRMAGRGGLAALLDTLGGADLPDRFQPFGMDERFSRAESLAEDETESFVRSIHSAYVKMRIEEAEQRPPGGRSLPEDPALRAWEDLPEDLRESNRQQADHIFIKMRAIGCKVLSGGDTRPALEEFEPEELEVLAEMEHRRWVAERKLAGWSYAAEKDVEKRMHPALVPWEELAEDVRELDREAVRVIPTLIAGVRMKACREVDLPCA